MRHRKTLISGIIAAVFSSTPVYAEKVSLSTALAPTHQFTKFMHILWADDVREATGGVVDFDVFSGGALLPATGTLQGVETGVAQAGWVGGAYYPSELPLAIMLNDLGFTHPDPQVLAAAYADFSMNDSAGYDEWRKNGVIYGSDAATPISYYLCAADVRTLADLDGKKVRTFGGAWANFAESIGMTPVNIPASEIFVALNQGAIDCAMTDLSQLTTGASILELTKSVVLLPLSPGFNMALHAYNPDFWQGISPDNKRKIWDQTALAMARTQIALEVEGQAALEAARAAGIMIVEPTEEMKAAFDAWVPSVVENAVEAARPRLPPDVDPQELVATFESYIEKWAALLEGVDRSDAEAVAAVLKAELFDKLDAETYGMD